MSKKTDPITKAELVQLRDTEQNSWANVAQALGLGSPGAARRAYSALVRPHTASVLDGRPQGEGKVQPVNLAEADLETVRETIAGRRIVVQRQDRTETIKVARVTSLKAGTVNFNDGNKARAVKTEAILTVR